MQELPEELKNFDLTNLDLSNELILNRLVESALQYCANRYTNLPEHERNLLVENARALVRTEVSNLVADKLENNLPIDEVEFYTKFYICLEKVRMRPPQ